MVRATYILRYILTKKLRRKVATQMSSSQSELRTTFFTLGKKKEQINKNKNNTMRPIRIRPIRIAYDYFLGVSEMMRLIRSQRCVSFALKFPPFIGACGLQRLCLEVTSQIFKEKRFSPGALLLGK